MPTTLHIGNTAPVAVYRVEDPEHARRHGASDAEVKSLKAQFDSGSQAADYRRKLKGQTTTTIVVPHDNLKEALAEIDALWAGHESDGPPAWVEASGTLADALRDHLIRSHSSDKHKVKDARPKDWKVTVE